MFFPGQIVINNHNRIMVIRSVRNTEVNQILPKTIGQNPKLNRSKYLITGQDIEGTITSCYSNRCVPVGPMGKMALTIVGVKLPR